MPGTPSRERAGNRPARDRLVRLLAGVMLVAVAACTPPSTASGRRSAEHPPATGPGHTVPSDVGTRTPTPTGSPTPRARPTVRVVMAGDVLLHDGLWYTAANDARKAGLPPRSLDFGPMFRPMRPLMSGADLAICHLETPLARPRGPFHDYPVFSVPPQVVSGLRRTGFDACTTASNHSVDQGYDGIRRTLRDLDRAGIAHAGTARSPQERRRTTIMDVHGVRVALLSYTYGTNGIPVAKPWSVNLIRPRRIREDARRAKAAGADAVLVALHWGNEYQHQPSGYQLRVARAVTRSPYVDLVYGHHAHVVQPIRRVNGTWVVFGLGNFIAQQSTAVTGVYEGMTARFDIVLRSRGKVSVRYAGYRPTYISPYHAADPAMRVYDIDRALRSGRHPAWMRRAMAAARHRVVAVAGPRRR